MLLGLVGFVAVFRVGTLSGMYTLLLRNTLGIQHVLRSVSKALRKREAAGENRRDKGEKMCLLCFGME